MAKQTTNKTPTAKTPTEPGYYWVLLYPEGVPQVAFVLQGGIGMFFPGESTRWSSEKFTKEYPEAQWSDRLTPPTF